MQELVSLKPNNGGAESSINKRRGFLLLFRNSIVRPKALLLAFCLTSCYFVKYGLEFSIEALKADFYISFAAATASGSLAVVYNGLLPDRIGRVSSLCFALLLAGACTISAYFVEKVKIYTLTVALIALTECMVMASMFLIFQVGGESFPTLIRGAGLGFCSMSANVGATVMPYILLIDQKLLVFGSVIVVAGLAAVTLPETRETNLPDTMEEAECIGEVGVKAANKNIQTFCSLFNMKAKEKITA